MNHPAFVLPGVFEALTALHKSTRDAGVPDELLEMVALRASQINGCSVCVEMHSTALQRAGQSNERIFGVAAWREAPYFSDAERSALALAEALTRLADTPDAVTDAIWDEATRHYDEKGLSALLLAISVINVWNRLNAATHQLAGSHKA